MKNEVEILMLKGEKGNTGDTGNGIESIIKTASVGNIDTYTITFTDGTTTTFDVANGEGATIVVDNLTDTSTNKALSANQGKVLKDFIDGLTSSVNGLDTGKVAITDIINNLTSTEINKPLSAYQGKVLKELIGIKKLTENLILVNGTAPTLEDGFYYTNGYSVYVNGTEDSNFKDCVFYYNNYESAGVPVLSIVYSYSFNGFYISYELGYVGDNWILHTVPIADEIDNTNTKVPSNLAVYNALQNIKSPVEVLSEPLVLEEGVDVTVEKGKLYLIPGLITRENNIDYDDNYFEKSIVYIYEANNGNTVVRLIDSPYKSVIHLNALNRQYSFSNNTWTLSSNGKRYATTIDSSSTDEQIPTAKAVYDYIQSILQQS